MHNGADSFDKVILPHLDAAFNLARWLAGNEQDAASITMESMLRASASFTTYRGGDPRTWLLGIVRTTCFATLKMSASDGDGFRDDESAISISDTPWPADIELSKLRALIAGLPLSLRELIVLREMEGLSYKKISQITGAPVSGVMSRLARARHEFQRALLQPVGGRP